MLALGRTFDPIELRRLGVLGGIKPDAKRALDWYRAAAQAGDATAEQSLSRLSEWVERTR
jgi:TPR repeat protein